MIELLLVFSVLYVFVIGFCVVADALFWSTTTREARKENRREKGLSDDDGGYPFYHWFRESALRRSLPLLIALLWGGIYVLTSIVSPNAGGMVGAALFFACIFYFILNCLFDIDGWLLDKEIEWDYRD